MRSLVRLAVALAAAGTVEAQVPVRASQPVPVMEGRAMTPDGVGLYYRVAGSGDEAVIAPFALLHESAFDALAVGRRVVTYDPRGRGRSDPVSPDKVSLSHLLLDLETVRKAVNAERVTLLGWSGAGMEMFVYASRNPGRVTRLVQLAPVAPRYVPYGPLMMEDRARRTDSVALAAHRRRVAAGAFGTDSAAECRAVAAIRSPALFADPKRPPRIPDVCRFPNEYSARLNTYFGALFGSIDNFNWRDSLAAVRIPRLVIHGARDNTPLQGNEEWVAGQQNARLLELEGAGHWPHYEQSRATIDAIETFLRGGWPVAARPIPPSTQSTRPFAATRRPGCAGAMRSDQRLAEVPVAHDTLRRALTRPSARRVCPDPIIAPGAPVQGLSTAESGGHWVRCGIGRCAPRRLA